MEQEERRRRFRTIFPLLVITALTGTFISPFFPQLEFWLAWSFIVMLMGAWIFGIWHVRWNPQSS